MLISGRNFKEAKENAASNASWSGVPYAIFFDSSGNLHIERITSAPSMVDWIKVVYPKDWTGALVSCDTFDRNGWKEAST